MQVIDGRQEERSSDAVLKSDHARVDGLHEGRLGQDPGDQVSSLTRSAQRRRRGSRTSRRNDDDRAEPTRRPQHAEEHVLDETGHFHVEDAPIDLSRLHRSRTGSRSAFFWLLGARRLLPVLHALRAERLGGVDRGDRALPADLHGVRRRSPRRCARTATSTSTSSTGCCRAAVGPRAVDARRRRAHRVLRATRSC